MTKHQKRCLTLGLGSCLTAATIIPTSLTLVSCANEQDQTNSNTANANKPSTSNPQATIQNSNLTFNSTQVKSIYTNLNSLLTTIKNDKTNRLFKLKYSYLNDTSKKTKTTSEGFMTTVMNNIMNIMHTKDLSHAIKSASFDVDRNIEAIIFTINFYPKALTNSSIGNNKNISFGDNGKDKNTLVMTFKMPNIGLATYITYHVMEKITLGLQEYVQNLYDQSITNIDYNVLNNNKGQLEPIMIKRGVNYKLICRPDAGFQIPTARTNSVMWYTGFHDPAVQYDPNCDQPNPDWEFDKRWGYFDPIWRGDLSHLFDGGRIHIIDMRIEDQITQLAQKGIRDPHQLEKQINTPAFSNKIWQQVFDNGFRFMKQGTNLIPQITFTNITTYKDEWNREFFQYEYSFSIPGDTPIANGVATNQWFVDYYAPLKKVNNSYLIKLTKPASAPFVPEEIDF